MCTHPRKPRHSSRKSFHLGRWLMLLVCIVAFPVVMNAEDVSEAWTTVTVSPPKANQTPFAVTTDAQGNAFVLHEVSTNYFRANTIRTVFQITKYAAADGKILWEKRYNGPTKDPKKSLLRAVGLVVDAEGNTYSAYTFQKKDMLKVVRVAKNSGATGELIWESFPGKDVYFDIVGVNLRLAPDGQIILGSFERETFNEEARFVASKLNAASGEVVWRSSYLPDQTLLLRDFTELEVGPTGDVAMTGIAAENFQAGVARVFTVFVEGTNGATRWVASEDGIYRPPQVTMDADGNVTTAFQVQQTGGTPEEDADRSDLTVVKHASADGAEEWKILYRGARDGANETVQNLAAFPAGDIAVSGVTGTKLPDETFRRNYYTMRLDGATGGQIWETIDNIDAYGSEFPKALFVTPADDVIVAGSQILSPFAVKYNGTTGLTIWNKAFFSRNLNAAECAALDNAGNVILGAAIYATKGKPAMWHIDKAIVKLVSTGAVPVVSGQKAQDVTATGAILKAVVAAAGSATQVSFEYGTTTSLGSQMDAVPQQVNGDTPTPVAATLSGLLPSTSYFFRVSATNSVGTSTGPIQSFTTGDTGGLPVVSFAQAAIAIAEGNTGTTNVQLTVNLSIASAASVTVQYDTSDVTAMAGSDYSAASGQLSFAPGETTKTIPVPITGDTLDEGTGETFEVRLSAPGGATLGSPNQVIVTISDDDEAAPTIQAPSVNTQSAIGITSTGATLRGVVTANGADATVDFEYGLDAGLGSSVMAVPRLVAGRTATQVSAGLTAQLTPSTTYFFRARATNSEGTTLGNVFQFTTLGAGQGNSPPVPLDDVAFVEPNEAITVSVLANDSDPNPGDELRIISVTNGIGTAIISPDKKKISYSASSVFVTDTITYEVSDGQDSATARLILGSFGSVAGQYTGRVTTGSLEPDENGVLDVAVLATGSFSGTLKWQDQAYPMKGRIGESGTVTWIGAKKGTPGTLQLDLIIEPISGEVSGTLLDVTDAGTLTAMVALSRVDTGQNGNGPNSLAFTSFIQLPGTAGPAEGAATAGLGPEPIRVKGIGLARILLSSKKVARIVARMPDGESFIASHPLANGKYALTEALYKTSQGRARGLVRGDLVFNRNGGNSDSERLDAQLQWKRNAGVSSTYYPNGIQASATLNARPFNGKRPGVLPIAVGAGASSNVVVEIDGGNLTSLLSRLGFASGKGKVKLNTNDIDFKFKGAKDGTFKGSFVHPVLKTELSFNGVFDQFIEEGRGVFAGSTESGSISIRAYTPQ